VVYAEWLGAAGKPTILVYAHYDVQPVSLETAAVLDCMHDIHMPHKDHRQQICCAGGPTRAMEDRTLRAHY
jgi:hypothetical protein